MKHKNEFNLETSIRNWKNNLYASHIITTDNIEELESHLLDEIDDLKLKGSTEEEAFIMATKQIGNKDFLVSEFGKVNVVNTIIVRCIPLLQLLFFYFTFQLFSRLSTSFSMFISEFFSLDLINVMTVSSTVYILVLVISMSSLLFYINNIPEKGKSTLRLIDNIPFFIGGFFFLWLGELSHYMLMTKGMSINEYGLHIYQDPSLKTSFFILGLMIILTIFLKSKKVYKRRFA